MDSALLDRLIQVDRRIIFAVLFAVVTAAIIAGISLPIRASKAVKDAYESIEALPEGSSVLVALDYDPATREELQPMARAVLRHCFQKKLKLAALTLLPTGVGITHKAIEETAAEFKREYGKDYVYLGYKAGDQVLIANLAEDFRAQFREDRFGNPLDKFKLTRGVKTLKDFDYLIVLTHGETIEFWIVYGQDKTGIPIAGGCTSVVAPELYPWYKTGQLDGFIGGLAKTSEYESLTGLPGRATESMSPLCAAHIVIIMFIFFGNTIYFLKRRKDRAGRL